MHYFGLLAAINTIEEEDEQIDTRNHLFNIL